MASDNLIAESFAKWLSPSALIIYLKLGREQNQGQANAGRNGKKRACVIERTSAPSNA